MTFGFVNRDTGSLTSHLRRLCDQNATLTLVPARFELHDLPLGFLSMTTRERAHALLDEFSDAELGEIVELFRVRREESEPEMAELPASWRHLPSGKSAPNWVAAVHKARDGR